MGYKPKDYNELLTAIKDKNLIKVQSLVRKDKIIIRGKRKRKAIEHCFKCENGKITTREMWEIYNFLQNPESFENSNLDLQEAIFKEDTVKVFSIIIEKKDQEKINLLDNLGRTPLDAANCLIPGPKKDKIINLIKKHGGVTSEKIKATLKKKEAEEIKRKAALREAEKAQAKQNKEKALKEYPIKFPLHHAVLSYKKDLIKKLLKDPKTSINQLDLDGKTPCDIAFLLEDAGKGLEIYNLLKKAGGATSKEIEQFTQLRSKASSKTNWEYKTEFFSDMSLAMKSFDSRLNELGKDGWEMVTQRRCKSDYQGWGVEVSLKRKN
jgi:ankyrin repeat protein